MPEWITVSSENYTNLGWKGAVEIHVDSSCLYDNYKSALKANPGLKACDGAVKDGPVLVCKISMEDSGATSDKSDSAVFGADFMYLGPDRAPVQFMVPFGNSSKKDASNNLFDFALAKDGYTEITVGFSVPQTWLNDSVANPQEWHKGADVNGFDYIAFGGDPEQYCVSAEGVVPTTDYIQLATTVVDAAQ